MVCLSEQVDGNYYVVEAVPDSARKEINIISAYLGKTEQQPTPGQRSTTNGLAPLSSHGAVNNSIAQEDGNSNRRDAINEIDLTRGDAVHQSLPGSGIQPRSGLPNNNITQNGRGGNQREGKIK